MRFIFNLKLNYLFLPQNPLNLTQLGFNEVFIYFQYYEIGMMALIMQNLFLFFEI